MNQCVMVACAVVQAVSTVVLAILTGFYVGATNRLARDTAQQAKRSMELQVILDALRLLAETINAVKELWSLTDMTTDYLQLWEGRGRMPSWLLNDCDRELRAQADQLTALVKQTEVYYQSRSVILDKAGWEQVDLEGILVEVQSKLANFKRGVGRCIEAVKEDREPPRELLEESLPELHKVVLSRLEKMASACEDQEARLRRALME